uniref:Glycosyltransferase (GlcNAc) n=1 Tax=viral metagenome TaxID=1070528 RepID=A0A6C0K1R3_9ZZZZ
MSTIFVSIASYRDHLCPITLISMYEMAANPDRVFVGLCQQNNQKEDEECVFPKAHPLYKTVQKNVRKVSIPHTQAKGPTYARFICASLYKNETYFLQVDSHSLFADQWDTHLLHMLEAAQKVAGHEKIILSTYPPIMEDYTSEVIASAHTPILETTQTNSHGIPVFQGSVYRPPAATPTRNYFISANLLFAPASLLREVPYDPHLPFLFEGEEILYSVRAYTHGWDVYAPNRNIIYHHYTRKSDPKFWDDLTLEMQDALIKTRFLLGHDSTNAPNNPANVNKTANLQDIHSKEVRNSISAFGLGTRRPLLHFYRESGITPPSGLSSMPPTYPSVSKGISWQGILIIVLVVLFLISLFLVLLKGPPVPRR